MTWTDADYDASILDTLSWALKNRSPDLLSKLAPRAQALVAKVLAMPVGTLDISRAILPLLDAHRKES